MITYFTRYHLDKSITMLNLLYDKLISTNKFIEYKGKKQLMVDDYARNKVLDKSYYYHLFISSLRDTKIQYNIYYNTVYNISSI